METHTISTKDLLKDPKFLNIAYPAICLFLWLAIFTMQNTSLFKGAFIVSSIALFTCKGLYTGKLVYLLFASNIATATYLGADLTDTYLTLIEPAILIMGIALITLAVDFIFEKSPIRKQNDATNNS
ncbi:MAG: hypothetical protein CMC13_14830 [Flavobacteriaceae bacterium]|nr:hypothetical protein [Flavobacteriaceae bacterium]|tara:strand:+ start:86522 stop:86902 length:381 start_codon:yes stop_codon:yes gene_type:complete